MAQPIKAYPELDGAINGLINKLDPNSRITLEKDVTLQVSPTTHAVICCLAKHKCTQINAITSLLILEGLNAYAAAWKEENLDRRILLNLIKGKPFPEGTFTHLAKRRVENPRELDELLEYIQPPEDSHTVVKVTASLHDKVHQLACFTNSSVPMTATVVFGFGVEAYFRRVLKLDL